MLQNHVHDERDHILLKPRKRNKRLCNIYKPDQANKSALLSNYKVNLN